MFNSTLLSAFAVGKGTTSFGRCYPLQQITRDYHELHSTQFWSTRHRNGAMEITGLVAEVSMSNQPLTRLDNPQAICSGMQSS